jgi:hypothetical protein
MPMSTLETILSRMMTEKAFADAVFSNAEKALFEYRLSPDELGKFKEMSRATFESLNTEERRSFFVINGNNEHEKH